jgi:hypothetical protein
MALVAEFLDHLEGQGLQIPFDSPSFRGREGAEIRRMPNVREFPPVEYRAMFALAQHDGLPTRLLDWTSKPLVAAYFAAVEVARATWEEGATPGRLCVWALNAQAQKWFADSDPSFELITAPTATNPNLHAQAGIFSLVRFSQENDRAFTEHPPTLCKLIGEASVDDMPGVDRAILPALVKVTLPRSEARSLLRLLAHYGVTAAQIYPGHKGAAQALLDQRWMQIAPPGQRS